MPENAISITRPGRYGNPFRVGDEDDEGRLITPEMAIAHFLFYLPRKYPGNALAEFLAPLRGKDLACWCPEGAACHGDVLLRLANE